VTTNLPLSRRPIGWRAFLGSLITPPFKGNELTRARARATLIFNAVFFIANLLLLIFALVLPLDSRVTALGIAISDILISTVVYLLIRAGRLQVAYIMFTLLLLIAYIPSMVESNGETTLALLIALPLVYAGFTLGVIAMLLVDVVGLAAFAIAVYTVVNTPNLPPNSFDPVLLTTDSIALPIILTIITGLIALLARAQERTIVRNEQIASQLRAAAQLSQATLSTLDLEVLLQRTIDYIRDQFGFYHAQIFLIDPQREYAVLAASTGEAGAALMARGHRLAVGSRSVIGQVTQAAQPFITEDTANDPVHRPNDLLPNTRAEMAIPLLIGSEVIGALDVQSTRPNVFNSDDVDSLRIVAAQISSAVRNAQLFAEQSATAAQNQRLFDQAERNLDEIEQLNQRLTSTAWGDYVQAQQSGALGIVIENGVLHREIRRPVSAAEATDGLLQHNGEQNGEHNGDRIGGPPLTTLPLVIGGRTIGTIEVELPPGGSSDEISAIVKAVADRLVFSLENARLLEQSEAAARQEATVNVISARMQAATTVNELLRVTVGELGRGLGAQKGLIGLTSQPPPSLRDNNLPDASQWDGSALDSTRGNYDE